MNLFAKRGYINLENDVTGAQKRKKFFLELADLAMGAAFPFMLMLILSASILSFASSDDFILDIVIIVAGELLLALVLVIFGKQNGTVAYRKSLQQAKKREIGTSDIKAILAVGEYSLYKGFVIGFISCVPYIIFQIVGLAAPNSFCDFLMKYAFGWAYYPLSFANVSGWLNLLWIIPVVCIHALAYYIGRVTEEKRDALAEKKGGKDKKSKK